MKILNQNGIGQQSFALPSDWEKTIGSGKDYTSVASAISALEHKYVAYPKLTLDAGTYAEKILDGTEKLLCPTIELIGDTRNIVGTTYIDTFIIRTNDSNYGGVGTCAISNSGNDITVTGTSVNPNFGLAGLVSGDKIITLDNSNAVAEYTIDSVSSNTITLTTTAPTIGNSGTSVCILPNRVFSHSASLLSGQFLCKIKLTGFYFDMDIDNNIFSLQNDKNIELNNCVFNHNAKNYDSIYLTGKSLISSSNETCCNVSFINSQLYAIFAEGSFANFKGLANIKTKGLYACDRSSFVLPNYTCTSGALQTVNYAVNGSSMYMNSAQIYGAYRGIYSFIGSSIWADYAYIAGCNVGMYANVESTNYAGSASLTGNTANASPATSGTAGNNNSVNVYS